jgi:hypothetical protein
MRKKYFQIDGTAAPRTTLIVTRGAACVRLDVGEAGFISSCDASD